MLALLNSKIIAAVRDSASLSAALESDLKVIFLLKSDVMTLPKMIKSAHEKEKIVFVHFDFADGFGKDLSGLKFISKIGVDGIISTRTNLIKLANDCGIRTIQRFFIVDSHSLETAIDAAKSSHPDMVELLPGVMPKVIKRFSELLDVPIITGGLIETEEEMISSLKAGADAVSTGVKELWNRNIALC